ncbi:hypothetical protein [uncultured Mucilaginibacter sp.]|uniref:hypothetical protein n=1 Tax=uncultured Mucilaginibacter sp. TaxID=797541 RepID=UPI0025F25532|nr:hypothetical protein [uncultured Mucilaginibacter sp.]
MKKLIKFCVALALFMTTAGLSKTFSQKLIFCDSVTSTKIVGQDSVFNIDDAGRIVTMLLYSTDVPFSTNKLVFKYYEVSRDTVEQYVTRQIVDVPPNSRSYLRKLPFSSPNIIKVKVFTYEGKLIADKKLTITALKQPNAKTGFSSVLNQIISFYPGDFRNIMGTKIRDDFSFPAWISNENLPGYLFATIEAEGSIERKYRKTTLIATPDSTEALNKYHEVSKLINQMKFDCCSFNMEEESWYNDPNYPNRKITTWFPAAVNAGKDKEYAEMPLELTFCYPFSPSKDFTVKLNIGFISPTEAMLYTLKHVKKDK